MGTQQMGTKVCLILCQIFLSGRRPDGYKAGWKYNSLGIKVAGTINETKSENYQEKDCVNVCDKERGQLISFRVEGLKQRQKKKKLYFTKVTSMGVGVMVLEKVEVMMVRGWGEFCPQIVSGMWEKHFWKRTFWGQNSERESGSGPAGPGWKACVWAPDPSLLPWLSDIISPTLSFCTCRVGLIIGLVS